jgi:transmembrane sensor
MNANQEMEKTLAHQASQWVTVLRGKASRAELAAFAEWLKTSPRHIREFLLMTSLEKELHQIDPERRYPLEIEPPRKMATLRGNRTTAGSAWRHRAWGWACAAGLTAIALIGILLYGQSHRYATATGEQRALELEDGSIVNLNTRSKVSVHMSSRSRDIDLMAGEALFKVHRDTARPFRVHVGDTVIEALGTEFNVYRRTHETTVSVVEGAVKVASTRLNAGEEAHIEARQSVVKRKTPDPLKPIAWRQRRLVFDQDSLADMVQEFNRYNKAPQLELEDAAAAHRHYTGVFDADDPQSLIQLLSAEPDLTIEHSGKTILIHSR